MDAAETQSVTAPVAPRGRIAPIREFPNAAPSSSHRMRAFWAPCAALVQWHETNPSAPLAAFPCTGELLK